MKSAGAYSHASHVTKVKRSAKVRMAGRIVLDYLCDRAEFYKPEVTVTKPQIERDTGLERKAIQRGLANLRAKGVIVPISGFEGGRGVPVTYTLVDIGASNEVKTPKGDVATRVSRARVRIMQEQPRLTWGEAQTLAKREVSA